MEKTIVNQNGQNKIMHGQFLREFYIGYRQKLLFIIFVSLMCRGSTLLYWQEVYT